MQNGGNIISPAIAKDNANQMIIIANTLNDLLNNVSRAINDVNSEEAGIYFGGKNPVQLREDLDTFRSKFEYIYGQITKSANDIIKIADTMENE